MVQASPALLTVSDFFDFSQFYDVFGLLDPDFRKLQGHLYSS